MSLLLTTHTALHLLVAPLAFYLLLAALAAHHPEKRACSALQCVVLLPALGQVDHLMALGSQFLTVVGGLLADMGSTAMLVKDAGTAKAKAIVDAYTSAEGVVKAHIDNAVQKRVDVLTAALGECAALLCASVYVAHGWTVPAIKA